MIDTVVLPWFQKSLISVMKKISLDLSVGLNLFSLAVGAFFPSFLLGKSFSDHGKIWLQVVPQTQLAAVLQATFAGKGFQTLKAIDLRDAHHLPIAVQENK